MRDNSAAITVQIQTPGYGVFLPAMTAVYRSVMVLLVVLNGMKYQGLSNHPYREAGVIMVLLVIAILTHGIATVATTIRQRDEAWPAKIILNFSGVLAVETLLWTLLVAFRLWIIFNVIISVVIAICFYKRIFVFLINSTAITPQIQTPGSGVFLPAMTAAVYGLVILLLVVLNGMKYQGLSNHPYREAGMIMLLLLIAILTLAIATVATTILQRDEAWPAKIILNFSGVLAVETLLWTLLVAFRLWIIFNVIISVAIAICFYKRIFVFLINSTAITPQIQTQGSGVFLPAMSAYGLVIVILVGLNGMKYQGLSNHPYREADMIMLLLLIAILTLAIATVATTILQRDEAWPGKIILNFSGVLAVETLVWTLLVAFRLWIIYNVIISVAIAICFYKRIFVFLINLLPVKGSPNTFELLL